MSQGLKGTSSGEFGVGRGAPVQLLLLT
jgi:hypothetical protein